MKPKHFKDLSERIVSEFRLILENSYTEFREVDYNDTGGQIYTLKLFYGGEYIDEVDKSLKEQSDIVRDIMYFQAAGKWMNKDLDINKFFSINEKICEEFHELGKRNVLNSLIPVLEEGKTIGKKDIGKVIDYTSFFFLSIDSCISGGNQYQRDFLEEGIVTIGVNDQSHEIEVDCSFMERKRITALVDGNPTKLLIPVDDIERFKQFTNEPEHLMVVDKYIFVVMSFQHDPLLVDAYETIKRTVKSLRKGLKCERVDEIAEDFVINEKIIDCIKKSKLIIVDLTGNRPNVYYELGYARALGKQIILIAREGERPHFDVSNQNIIFYSNSTSLGEKLNKRLRTLFK